MIKVYPSVLAADMLHMGKDVEDVLAAGADGLHIDIMDGHFVPNLSYGPELVRALRKAFPQAVLDVHLMLSAPEKYLDTFIGAGASAVTIHFEADRPEYCLAAIRAGGIPAGLSIKPNTRVQEIRPLLDRTDSLLVMTVEPGFGGQKLMPHCVQKARELRLLGYRKPIAFDGGVNAENAPECAEAGADVLVMGTAVFHAENRAEAIARLHAI